MGGHAICGAIAGWGRGDAPGQLQRGWLDHPLLPPVSEAVAPELDEAPCPYGGKILLGGGGDGIAEVEPSGFVRAYLLVLHRE